MFEALFNILLAAICAWAINGVFTGMLIFITFPLAAMGLGPLSIWYISLMASIAILTVLYYKLKALEQHESNKEKTDG